MAFLLSFFSRCESTTTTHTHAAQTKTKKRKVFFLPQIGIINSSKLVPTLKKLKVTLFSQKKKK